LSNSKKYLERPEDACRQSPASYFAVEALRQAKRMRKIAFLEEMLSIVPKHKGTDHLRADLRRRLSKLKSAAETHKSGGRQSSLYHIDPEGAGQIAVIGHSNVGKSALLKSLTSATPEVSPAPFTTWSPTPGMMHIEDVQVQLIDTPPLNRDFIEPLLMDMLRRGDLILLMLDMQADPIEQLEESLAVLRGHRIIPKELEAQYEGQPGLFFVPLMVVVNKVDNQELQEYFDILCELMGGECPLLPVSIEVGFNIDRMKQIIFDKLEIIRIYSKAPGKGPDLTVPFVMKKRSTIDELAGKVHKDFTKGLKSARVWGQGVFDGQLVGRDHVLHDGDIVELRI
jgi:ribosome-interacting GTPase 1